MTLFRFYVTVILLNSAIFTLLHFLFPQHSDFIFSEDNLVENLNEEMENLIMFKHELVIAFEKASAKITVATSVIENNWRILGIKLT